VLNVAVHTLTAMLLNVNSDICNKNQQNEHFFSFMI